MSTVLTRLTPLGEDTVVTSAGRRRARWNGGTKHNKKGRKEAQTRAVGERAALTSNIIIALSQYRRTQSIMVDENRTTKNNVSINI